MSFYSIFSGGVLILEESAIKKLIETGEIVVKVASPGKRKGYSVKIKISGVSYDPPVNVVQIRSNKGETVDLDKKSNKEAPK